MPTGLPAPDCAPRPRLTFKEEKDPEEASNSQKIFKETFQKISDAKKTRGIQLSDQEKQCVSYISAIECKLHFYLLRNLAQKSLSHDVSKLTSVVRIIVNLPVPLTFLASNLVSLTLHRMVIKVEDLNL